VIDSPAVQAWWAKEQWAGGSVLVQNGDLLEVLERDPGNVVLRDARR